MDINRVFWGSRRGMLELDLILLPFVEQVYPQLTPEEQRSYQRLLTCEDQDMYAWFMQRKNPQDEELQRIVDYVRRSTGATKS